MQISAVNSYSGMQKHYQVQPQNHTVSFSADNTKIPEGMDSYEYACLYEKNFLNKLNERKEELYKFLDSAKLGDGTAVFDAISGMFDTEETETRNIKLLHKTGAENIEIIQKNGFSPEKISATEYGPGVYFSQTEGVLTIYSGKTLKFDYTGRTANGKNLQNYNKVNSDITNTLRRYLNLPADFSNRMIMNEQAALRRFTHEYTRHTIADKLGIDGAYATTSDGYFVVFNPDAVKLESYY